MNLKTSFPVTASIDNLMFLLFYFDLLCNMPLK